MNYKKILVTGASGFVGSRLCEHLHCVEKVPFRAQARRPQSAIRLNRFPLEMVWGDINEKSFIQSALEGCDAVVHCAYGADGNRSEQRCTTVDATRLLAQASIRARVKRFVHISSIAVYSYTPPHIVNEDTPLCPGSDPYCKNKADAEIEINKAIYQGLPAVILRPGNIWGPFSKPWTVRPLNDIKNNRGVCVEGGEHCANFVFIDNLVEAILLALSRESAVGESFFITDNETSWRKVYQSYADWCDHYPLRNITTQELSQLFSSREIARAFLRSISHHIKKPELKNWIKSTITEPVLGEWLYNLYTHLPSESKKYADKLLRKQRLPERFPFLDRSENLPSLRELPSRDLLKIYASQTIFPNQKAKKTLGYRELTDIDTALSLTREWASWANYI